MGVGQVLGGIGGMQAAKARNAAAKRQYAAAVEQRKRNYLQNLSIHSAKVNKYTIDLNENDLAANRGYAKAQAELGRVQSKALASSESAYIKMVREKMGKVAAGGQTGRSAARLETMVSAEYGRKIGRLAFALTRSGEAYQENVENIRRQQMSQRNKLFSNVAFVPVPGMAPTPPVMENTSMPLVQGIVGAAAGAFGAREQNLFSEGGNTGGTTGSSTDLNSGMDIGNYNDYSGAFDKPIEW